MSSDQGGTPTQPSDEIATPPLQEYRVILTQPSVCNTQLSVKEQKLCLRVSRDEILSAAMHFKGARARDYLLEGIDKGFPIIELTILNKNLGEYLDAMFTGGRWTDNMNNPNEARCVTMIDYNKGDK